MTKEERLQRDISRLAEMKAHEDELRQQGYRYIAGIDEVGRGPLAGPVYAACVLLPPDFDVLGIYDSKKISAKKREELSDIIKEKALAYGIGIADNNEIDEINILEATKVAMRRAFEECNKMLTSDRAVAETYRNNEYRTVEISKSNEDRIAESIVFDNSSGRDSNKSKIESNIDYLMVDALKLEFGVPCEPIVKGDEKSLSIAAASIVAKVARDKYMEEIDAEYPGYDFASNKGYGTAAHYEGLRSKGITPIHRRSFLKKFEENPNTGHNKQTKTQSTSENNPDGIAVCESAEVITTESKEQTLAKKVYAVKKGKTTGIFMTWEDCKAQVDGFAGAEYKSFADPQDAMAYLGLYSGGKGASKGASKSNAANKNNGASANGGVGASTEELLPPGNRAYVDGSYDNASNRFSCGVVIIETDKNGISETTELKAVFEDDVAALQRNVAGEVMGAKTAIDYCLENGIDDIEIYHDYEGVGKWADGLWKANNPLTQGYKQFIADARRVMSIRFVKVKAHAGNKYNEMADKLAKQALDL